MQFATALALIAGISALVLGVYTVIKLHSAPFVGANGKMNAFHLQEFKELHPEVKALYYDAVVTKLAPAGCRYMTNVWNALPADKRAALRTSVMAQVEDMIQRMESETAADAARRIVENEKL